MAGQGRIRALWAAAALALVGACSNATTREAAPQPEPVGDRQPAATEPAPETTTTTLSPELQVVADLGVTVPPAAALPAHLGIVGGPSIDVEEGSWPDALYGAFDDPPGDCEGPIPLDSDLLGPTVRSRYSSDLYETLEVVAVPVDAHTADAVTTLWWEQSQACTTDVTEGAFMSRHAVVMAPGGPVVAAQLEVDRTLIPTYSADRPDPPIVDTARWFGVVGDLLYAVSVSGAEPVDAMEAATALVNAIHGVP